LNDERFPLPIRVKDGNDAKTWVEFWQNPPNIVGIDTEGNQMAPPVLLQISTQYYTILEVPLQKQLSSNVTRLLKDDAIIKVFCDNFSHNDKKCLGLALPPEKNFSKPPIVDLESLCNSVTDVASKVPRGLSNIVSMSFPELNVRIKKPSQSSKRFENIGRFAMIEQGKAKPLKGFHDLTSKEKQYSALDSWCTLQAYLRILSLQTASSDSSPMNMDLLSSGNEQLADFIQANQVLKEQLTAAKYLLVHREEELKQADAKIKRLEEQLIYSTTSGTWDGPHVPDSEDDTVHPIGSKQDRRRKPELKKNKTGKNININNNDREKKTEKKTKGNRRRSAPRKKAAKAGSTKMNPLENSFPNNEK
jgi:hypothetical protein